MYYTLIIAAGKQHRFKSELPKALVDINGRPLLEYNIETALNHTDKVIVVASTENHKYFDMYKSDKVDVIVIESGYGCGDAVWQALNQIKYNPDDYCFIMWGDSMQRSDSLYTKCINSMEDCIVPVVKEESPYVQIVANSNNEITGAKFSKYNEDIEMGSYHDLSFFYSNIWVLHHALQNVHDAIIVDDKYVCKHGNELTFLDIFNYDRCFDKPAKIMPTNETNSFAFNTIEEYIQLKNNIK